MMGTYREKNGRYVGITNVGLEIKLKEFDEN